MGQTDGVINIQIAADVLARGTGRIHGIDASASMISAATKAAETKGLGEDKCSFEGGCFSMTLFFSWMGLDRPGLSLYMSSSLT